MNIHEQFDLKGRAAIVTGGAGLLGRQFVKTLLEAGAQVVIADLAPEQVYPLAKEFTAQGYPALGVSVDVTDPQAVQRLVDKTVDAFGRLDILVNSAGMDPKFEPGMAEKHTNAFEDYPLELWNQALNVNLTGMFLCCQAACRVMVGQAKAPARPKGSIINICSTYGLVGPDQRIYQRPGQPTRYKPVFYTVSKAGVLGLTHYLSTYYAGTEIRCNALTPGGVFNNHDETFVRAYSYRTVMGRMAHPHEMNGALLFLASDASSYMTGGNVVVDGGWTAW